MTPPSPQTDVGEDLQKLVTVQHFLFGPLLVALTYVLGRLVTSRPAALVAAALVAISGPLLLYEHYVMTEVPFAILLLALLSTTVLATRQASLVWAGVAVLGGCFPRGVFARTSAWAGSGGGVVSALAASRVVAAGATVRGGS